MWGCWCCKVREWRQLMPLSIEEILQKEDVKHFISKNSNFVEQNYKRPKIWKKIKKGNKEDYDIGVFFLSNQKIDQKCYVYEACGDSLDHCNDFRCGWEEEENLSKFDKWSLI